MSDIAIHVSGLGKRYRLGANQQAYKTLKEKLTQKAASPFRVALHLLTGNGNGNGKFGIRKSKPEMIWALKDVSFEIKRGEVVGIIGRNGAGKSTLLKVLSRITEPTEGYADIHGRVGSLLEVGTGFQPELTGRENIFLNGSILGMTRAEIARNFDAIVEFSGVERFIDTPVKRYSSGMFVRLAFSVAAHFEPEIMIVDEVLSVGDADFQRRSLGRMETIGDSGRTVLFVSHNLQGILQLCDRTILLVEGRIARYGPTPDVVAYYEERAMGMGRQFFWEDDETAPGSELVRLRSVRVVDEEGESIVTFDVRRPIGIEIGFR